MVTVFPILTAAQGVFRLFAPPTHRRVIDAHQAAILSVSNTGITLGGLAGGLLLSGLARELRLRLSFSSIQLADSDHSRNRQASRELTPA